LGVFHWPEDTFWGTSLRAWDRAVAGYRKANGADEAPRGMTQKRLAELKAQFPDG